MFLDWVKDRLDTGHWPADSSISMAPMHVASVKQTTEPTTATFKHKDFNTLMCCGAMLSKKESVLRIRKSKKNNVSKEHPVSLVFTARFTTHSARDVFVIKLARHGLSSRSNLTCSLTGSRTRLWSRVTRGSSPPLACFARSSCGRPYGLNALWNL